MPFLRFDSDKALWDYRSQQSRARLGKERKSYSSFLILFCKGKGMDLRATDW